MDRLNQVFATIRKSLGALTPTGRLVIAMAMLVGLMALLLTAFYAGAPVMTEITAVSPDQMGRAQSLIKNAGIRTSVKGNALMVPEESKDLAIGLLAENGCLTDDTTVMFSNLSAKQNWMNSKSDNDRQANLALQNELARVIAKFKGVRSAQVFMDAPEPIGLGMAYRKPTATVNVFTQSGRPLDAQKVDAIGALVAGAKAGLAITDVSVIDGTTGRQYRAHAGGEYSAGDYMEHVANVETRLQGKLLEALRYIPGVIVSVNAQVNLRKTSLSETSMLPVSPTGGSVAIVSKETTQNSTSGGASRAAEPGARSNVTDDINSGGGSGGKQSEETSDTEYKVAVGNRRAETIDPGGAPTKMNVTVNVSREYIAALVKQSKGAAAADPKTEITQAEIDTAFTAERDRITKDIAPLVETVASSGVADGQPVSQAGIVTVSLIPLPMVIATEMGTAQAGILGVGGAGAGTAGASGMINSLAGNGLVKQGVLVALALGALGMMAMLVRKSAKPVTLPSAQEIVGEPPALQAQSDLVGEADETQTAMMGIELGDDELKTKKMLEQVGEMVRKNPADSAALINRWVTVEE